MTTAAVKKRKTLICRDQVPKSTSIYWSRNPKRLLGFLIKAARLHCITANPSVDTKSDE